MSKRLQVLLPDQEMTDIQRLAKREHVTVGEWVRRALRQARAGRPATEPQTKLKAIRRAAAYSFPTSDIEQMLSEIERGYRG
ncbi:MAG TPA: ribbon-helix-helix protein, CopG family [Bryobacteraceae bacterium]|nr:ribbon-helix-helix protein, CopG family [Bryobacteraceae bacterium]